MAALALAWSEEGVPAAVTLLALGGPVLLLAVLSAPPPERRLVAVLFAAAVALRTVAASLIYHWNPSFFSLDQGAYYNHGAALAQQWRAEGSGPSLQWLVAGPGNHFHELWAVLSYYVGPSQLALRTAMGVVGAYTAVRAYVLAREVAGKTAGRWVGWLAACWPSFIVWSAQGLRDPLLIWLWCEVALGTERVRQGRTVRGLVGLTLAVYGITLFRPYAAVLAGLGASLALVISSMGRARGAGLVGVGAVGLALSLGGLGFLGSEYLAGADIETAAEIHRSFWGGGSSFAIGRDISTYGAAAVYLPFGFAYFMLGPFPWQGGSALQMSTMLEQPVWYALVWFGLLGLATTARRRGVEGLSLAGTALPGLLFYALAMSNMGTGYRDRAQFLPMLFVYSAVGLAQWRAIRAARRERWRWATKVARANRSVGVPAGVSTHRPRPADG